MKPGVVSYLLMLALLACAAAFSVKISQARSVPPRKDFAEFPQKIGPWRSSPMPPFDERTVELLGTSDYLYRLYTDGPTQVSLYVGYYRSQRAGESIHSPKACLPANGFEVIESKRIELAIPAANRTIPLNHYVLQRDQERILTLYWYETHGRVIANEYEGKAVLVWEALRTGRTDGALVRVITNSGEAGEAAARQFVQQVFPILREYLADQAEN